MNEQVELHNSENETEIVGQSRLSRISPINGNQSVDVSSKLINQPIMVSDDLASNLKGRIELDFRIEKNALEQLEIGPVFGSPLGRDRKPYIVDDGIAIINIKGILEHDSLWYSSWWTGYEAIRMRFDEALKDPVVRGIALMVDTNGGQVAGNFDLTDHIYSSRDKKPIIAIVNERAYSAGYSLASGASKIYVNRTGGVGSIGVITVHFDCSKAMAAMGVRATIIHAGKFKADGNPYESLPKDVQTRMQSRIDDVYTLFVDTVARNRSMDANAVRNTEAATFSGENAVSIGLADAVMSSNEALAAFKKELNGSTMTTGVNFMTTENQHAGAAAQPGQGPQNTAETGYTQAHLDQAVSDAKVEGAKSENERVMTILGSESAKGREQAALVMAKNMAMPAESAEEMLTGLPQSSSDLLGQAMEQSGGGSGVGAGGGTSDGQHQAVVIDTDSIYARLNNAPVN